MKHIMSVMEEERRNLEKQLTIANSLIEMMIERINSIAPKTDFNETWRKTAQDYLKLFNPKNKEKENADRSKTIPKEYGHRHRVVPDWEP